MEDIIKDIGNDSGIDFFKVELVPRKYELEIVPLTGGVSFEGRSLLGTV
jgi:hypothetical protein